MYHLVLFRYCNGAVLYFLVGSRYSSLMGIIAKKFANKRKVQEALREDGEPNHKKCFMKPSDVD